MSRKEHVANVGDRGARRRRLSGIVWLVIALALVIVLMAIGAERWLRLVVAIPAGLAATGFLQARERT